MNASLFSILMHNALLLLFFAIVLHYNKKYKQIANKILSIMFILMGISGFLMALGQLKLITHLFFLDSLLAFAVSPFFFFYFRTFLRNRYSFNKIHLLHLIPFVIQLILWLLIILPLTEEEKNSFLSTSLHNLSFYIIQRDVLMLIIVIIYTFYIVKDIKGYNTRVREEYSYVPHNILNWFYAFVSIFVLCGLLISVTTFIANGIYSNAFVILINILFSSLIFIVILRPEIYMGIGVLAPIKLSRRYTNVISMEQKRILHKKLKHEMEMKQYYLNPKLNLNSLSKKLKSNSSYVSQTINTIEQKSFLDFINFYRVEHAQKLLLTPEYDKYTVEFIAKESGFKSLSAFYNAFKKFAGVTPKEFLKERTRLIDG